MANKLNALEGRNIDSLTVSCCIGASSCDAHFVDFRLMMIGFAIKKESVVQSNSHKKAGTVAGQKKCNIFPSAFVNTILVYPRVRARLYLRAPVMSRWEPSTTPNTRRRRIYRRRYQGLVEFLLATTRFHVSVSFNLII